MNNAYHEDRASLESRPTVMDLGAELSGADPLLGALIDRRYRVLDVLGEGNQGRLYLVEHVALLQHFVLKALHPHVANGPRGGERFAREARLIGRTNSPHLIEGFDYGTLPDGRAFYVMEHVRGMTLETRLVTHEGRLSIGLALHIAKQMATALEHAHGQGIVHRDLKPENVVLTRQDHDDYFVKVVDFGLARALESETITIAGTLVGTPRYLAPEQCFDQPVDTRTDIYTLGLILHEMLAGPDPRLPESLAMVIQYRAFEKLPSPLPDAANTRAINELVLRCLERDPARRFQHAADLSLAIEQAMARWQRPPEEAAKEKNWKRAAGILGIASALATLVMLVGCSSLYVSGAIDTSFAPRGFAHMVSEPASAERAATAEARPARIAPIEAVLETAAPPPIAESETSDAAVAEAPSRGVAEPTERPAWWR